MFLTFPCPIHTFILDIPNVEDLVQFVYTERRRSDGVKKSNAGGWQSEDNYNGDNPITSIIHPHMEKLFADRSLFKESLSVKMNSLWINLNEPGNYNHSHNHPGSDLSGVLWLKVPPKSGNIVFESPHSFTEHKLLNSYSKEFVSNNNLHDWFFIEPQAGLLILFPSHLNHSVTQNKSDQDRISVAFNLSFA